MTLVLPVAMITEVGRKRAIKSRSVLPSYGFLHIIMRRHRASIPYRMRYPKEMIEKIELVCTNDIGQFNKKANALIADGYDMNHGFRVIEVRGETHFAANFTKVVYPTPTEQSGIAERDDGEDQGPTPYDEAIENAMRKVQKHHNLQKAVWADKVVELINKRREWRYTMNDETEIAKYFRSADSA